VGQNQAVWAGGGCLGVSRGISAGNSRGIGSR
jgi:hypothetical protein